MTLVLRRIIAWAYVVLWMMLIFTLSSIPDLRSGLQPMWDLVLRKCAHAAEYAILGWLSYRAFVMSGMSRNRALIFSIVLSVLYAASDEYHQRFVPGRHGAVMDAALDSFGVCVGILMNYRRK